MESIQFTCCVSLSCSFLCPHDDLIRLSYPGVTDFDWMLASVRSLLRPHFEILKKSGLDNSSLAEGYTWEDKFWFQICRPVKKLRQIWNEYCWNCKESFFIIIIIHFFKKKNVDIYADMVYKSVCIKDSDIKCLEWRDVSSISQFGSGDSIDRTSAKSNTMCIILVKPFPFPCKCENLTTLMR